MRNVQQDQSSKTGATQSGGMQMQTLDGPIPIGQVGPTMQINNCC
jgi:hypothetical protein